MAKQRIIPIVYKVDYRQVDQSTQSVKKAEQETEKFNKQVKQTEPISKKAFGALKNAIIATGVTAIIGTLTKKIFDLGVANEQTAIAFNTLTGSVAKGTQLLKQLTKFSIETPFTPDQVNKAAKALLAFGVDSKKVIPTLKLLGDVASGTGKDLTEMAVIFGQIRSTGRLMGQDLLQLINAGFNPLQIISQKTGKSVADLKKEMEKGLISFDMVEQAFKDATSAGGLFFNLMEKQSVSLGGKLSTVEGNFEELGKAIFKLSTGPIPEIVDKFNVFLQAFTEFLNAGDLSDVAELSLERFRKKFEEVDAAIQSGAKNASELQNIFAKDLVDAINEVTTERSGLQEQMESGILTQDEAAAKDELLRLELVAFKDLLKETIGLKKKDVEKTREQTKEDKDRKKALEELNKQMGFTTASQKVNAKEKEAKELEKIEKENNDRSNENADRQYKYEQEKLKQAQEERWRILEEQAERERGLKEEAFEFGVDAIGGLLFASTESFDKENEALQNKYDEQIRLAGDNERAKEQIELQRETEEKKLRSRQLEEEKRQQTRRILIETVLNAVKALGLPPIPGANYIAAAKATAYGLLSAGIARRYAKGSEVGIKGPGTTTSDSIDAKLSVGETVMSSEQTNASKGILKAIKAKKLDDRMVDKLYKRAKGSDGTVIDFTPVVKAIKEQKHDDVIKKGSYLYDVKRRNADNTQFVRRKYIS